jgi:hypothetical protein
MNDSRARADNRIPSDRDTVDHNRPGTDPTSFPDYNPSAKHRSRRDMSPRLNAAIMLDYRSGIHNYGLADLSAGVHDGEGKYHATAT